MPIQIWKSRKEYMESNLYILFCFQCTVLSICFWISHTFIYFLTVQTCQEANSYSRRTIQAPLDTLSQYRLPENKRTKNKNRRNIDYHLPSNKRQLPTQRCYHSLCTFFVVFLFFHWTSNMEISNIVPPDP